MCFDNWMQETTAQTFQSFAKHHSQSGVISELTPPLCASNAINLNLLLFTVWYARAGWGRIQKKEMAALYEAVFDWHRCVSKPLLQIKSNLASRTHATAAKIHVWVVAEFAQAQETEWQFLAETSLTYKKNNRSPVQRLADANYNIMAYLKHLSIVLNEPEESATLHLLQSIFTEASLLELHLAWQHAMKTAGMDKLHYQQIAFPIA